MKMFKFNVFTFVTYTLGFMYFWSNGSFNPNNKGFYIAVLGGIFASVLSEFLLSKTYPLWMRNFSNKVEKTIELVFKENEEVLYQSGSNHLKGFERVGGKLFLTNKRFVFKSHKLNIQNHEVAFDPLQIEKIETPNGKRFNFEYKGKLEKFIVDSPKEWTNQLESFKNP